MCRHDADNDNVNAETGSLNKQIQGNYEIMKVQNRYIVLSWTFHVNLVYSKYGLLPFLPYILSNKTG